MTLTAQILAFGDTNKTSFEIAKIVGCRDSYVRAVWQRQRGEVVAKERARERAMLATADIASGNKAGRVAYAAVRSSGGSVRDAQRAYVRAKSRVVVATYDKAAASAAYKASAHAR